MSSGIILTEANAEDLAVWCGGRAVVQHDALDNDRTTAGVNVPTKQGVQRAQVGDLIVRQNDGTFRIEKADR
jgi:hypothetical protein